MAVTLEQFGLTELPPDDRLELMELLWDSLEEGSFKPPEWHVEELERRRADAEANPSLGVHWGEFKRQWLGES